MARLVRGRTGASARAVAQAGRTRERVSAIVLYRNTEEPIAAITGSKRATAIYFNVQVTFLPFAIG